MRSLLLLAACSSLWAGCEDETEFLIHASCVVTGVRSLVTGETAAWTDKCKLETMTPKAGFNNLYRVVVKLAGPAPIMVNLVVSDYVKAQNTELGQVRLTSMLWGNVLVTPDCTAIRASVASRAPAFEVRPQTLKISLLDEKTLEILIEERWGEFYGGLPSPEWQACHLKSFSMLSQAK